MKHAGHRIATALTVLLAAAAVSPAQQREPHIGYIYPAGGRQGDTFTITVGGQYLDGVTDVQALGGDMTCKIGRHIKALTQQQLNGIRNNFEKMVELEKLGKTEPARLKEAEAVRKRIEATLREAGIDEFSLRAITEYRRKTADPKRQLNPSISETVSIEVTLPRDAEPGDREIRLKTPAGLTNPLLFRVGRWPEHVEKEPNDQSPDAGLKSPLPVVLNGQILPGDVDRFRFPARKGQKIVAAASARELVPYLADAVPGWFQATLAIYDAKGKEIAYDDDFRFQPDPAVYCEIPADGEYVIEIKDSIYRGREDFVYRIALGEFPFVTGVFPMGGRTGEVTQVELTGWNLPVRSLKVDATAAEPGPIPVGAAKPVGAINQAVFTADTWPESLEAEPNGSAGHEQKVTLPCVVNGRIGRTGDVDLYRFDARAGDEIVAEVCARRQGSPLDSVLVLVDKDGRQVAMNDDFEDKGAGLITHQADSRLCATIKEAGRYTLRLADGQQKGGEDYIYRLRIGPPRPDFALRIAPSALNVNAGATVAFAVFAMRQDGFDGDIALSLKDPPPGFHLGGAWIPAGQEKARLTLSCPATAAREPVRLRLVGTATNGSAVIRREAVPAEDMMQAFFFRHLVPAQDRWLVSMADRNRRTPVRRASDDIVRLASGGVTGVRFGMGGYMPVNQVKLALSDPPDGIEIANTSFGRDGFNIEIKTDAEKVKPGLKGNLIVEVFYERASNGKSASGKPKVNTQRFPVGFLPAIPYEIVAAKK